jgi:hypothetical protein
MNVLAMTVLKSYSFSVRQHTFTYLEYMKMNHKEKKRTKIRHGPVRPQNTDNILICFLGKRLYTYAGVQYVTINKAGTGKKDLLITYHIFTKGSSISINEGY